MGLEGERPVGPRRRSTGRGSLRACHDVRSGQASPTADPVEGGRLHGERGVLRDDLRPGSGEPVRRGGRWGNAAQRRRGDGCGSMAGAGPEVPTGDVRCVPSSCRIHFHGILFQGDGESDSDGDSASVEGPLVGARFLGVPTTSGSESNGGRVPTRGVPTDARIPDVSTSKRIAVGLSNP